MREADLEAVGAVAAPGASFAADASSSRTTRRLIGRGRSAEVWLVEGPAGRWVEKVFVGDAISNLVQRLATGAPHPYRWNEDAALATLERRRILAVLIEWWFGDTLAMAEGRAVRWDDEARSFVLLTDFADGAPMPLLHPLRPEDAAAPRLWGEVMPSLQERLVESGFFGMVWQAGLGNPKALSNYLYDPDTGAYTFVDGESGVPAIFAVTLSSWRFYAAMIRRFGRPIMDDVDCNRLRAYLHRHETPLAEHLGGPAPVAALQRGVDRLDILQRRWHGLPRRERARRAQERLGKRRRPPPRPWLQTGRRIAVGVAAALRRRIDLKAMRRFATSQAYRTELGETYVRVRIEHWQARRQMNDANAAELRTLLAREREAGRYLTDFGAHLGMKASFFAAEVLLVVALSLLGVPLYLLGAIVVFDGPIYRTLYTGYRGLQNLATGRKLPWVALAVGLVPFFGTLAFPAQMLWSASGQRDDVARFIVYDTFSRLAASVPLVGGEDTSLEHRLNRAARRTVGV